MRYAIWVSSDRSAAGPDCVCVYRFQDLRPVYSRRCVPPITGQTIGEVAGQLGGLRWPRWRRRYSYNQAVQPWKF
jgi:hypothetical protein